MTARIQQLVIRAGAGTLRRPLTWSFLLAARVAGRALGRGAPVYVAGSFARDDAVVGVSDLDVVVLARDESERARIGERRARLGRHFPRATRMLQPAIATVGELERCAAATHRQVDGAIYFGPGRLTDETGASSRPPLGGPGAGWRLLDGPDLRPPRRAWTPDERRVVAWLALQHWWRIAFELVSRKPAVYDPHVCVKLGAEPARTLHWLRTGEIAPTRAAALRLAGTPEAAALLDLERRLQHQPPADQSSALAVLSALTGAVAAELAAAAPAYVDVALTGLDAPVAGAEAGTILADWRSLVAPPLPDTTVTPAQGAPADPAALRSAVAGDGLTALRGDGFVVLAGAGGFSAGVLRSVQCAVSDPAAWALLAGEAVARFPELPGFSAADTARRAVVEHRAHLADPSQAPVAVLAGLLDAARAALFALSLRTGTPSLAVGAIATARALAVDGVEDAYLAARADGTAPPRTVIDRLRPVVDDLLDLAGP